MHSGIREKIAKGLHIDLQGKTDVYATIYASAEIASLSYWMEVALSSGIATMGLVQNSPAVIIGAMLISPLMGPILSTGLALAIGDSYLLLKSILNLLLSMAASAGLSGLLVWLLPFHTVTQEIVARIHPNLLDLGIAILSGLAGSIVVCRGGSANGVMALPGVAIAVALMPPLCVAGFGIGNSLNLEIVYGASLLFLTNMVAIVSSAFAVFLLVGMDETVVQGHVGETLRARGENERLYQALERSSVHRILSLAGSLRWRALMLVILLAIVFVPLRAGLIQVKNEVVARGAVQDALRDLVPPEALVSQRVRYAPGSVDISILSVSPVPSAKIDSARGLIERRTGSKASIQIQEVASRSELSDLVGRLAPRPEPVAPKPLTMETLGSDVLAQIKPVVDEIWPADTPILSWELGFSPDGPVAHFRYESKSDMEPFSIALLQQTLQSRLGLHNLRVETQRVRPQRNVRKAHPAM